MSRERGDAVRGVGTSGPPGRGRLAGPGIRVRGALGVLGFLASQLATAAPPQAATEAALDLRYLGDPDLPRRRSGPIVSDDGAAVEFRWPAGKSAVAVGIPVPWRFTLSLPGHDLGVLPFPADPFDGRARFAVAAAGEDAGLLVTPGRRVPYPVATVPDPPTVLFGDAAIEVSVGGWGSVGMSGDRRGRLRYVDEPPGTRSLIARMRLQEIGKESGEVVWETPWRAPSSGVRRPVVNRVVDLAFGHDAWIATGVVKELGERAVIGLIVNVTRQIASEHGIVVVRAARLEYVGAIAFGAVSCHVVAESFREGRTRLVLELVLTEKG